LFFILRFALQKKKYFPPNPSIHFHRFADGCVPWSGAENGEMASEDTDHDDNATF